MGNQAAGSGSKTPDIEVPLQSGYKVPRRASPGITSNTLEVVYTQATIHSPYTMPPLEAGSS